MAADTYVYDVRDIVFTFGPVLVSKDHAEGAFVTVAKASDAFTSKVGGDGNVTRQATNNKLATVTLRLAKKSPSNTALGALHTVDTNTTNGAGVYPLMIKDVAGTTLHGGFSAWIKKQPDDTFGQEADEREWTFEVAQLESAF